MPQLSACYPRRRTPGARTLKRRNSDDWTGRKGAEFGIASAADEAQALLDSEQQQQQQQQLGGSNATLVAMHSATSASVLGMLSSSAPAGAGGAPQPRAGMGGSSLAQHPHHGGSGGGEGDDAAQRSAVWGRRIVGWSQRVGALTGRGAAALGSGLTSGSAAAVRGTSGLLARVWLQVGSGGRPWGQGRLDWAGLALPLWSLPVVVTPERVPACLPLSAQGGGNVFLAGQGCIGVPCGAVSCMLPHGVSG
jgi:hypothetical protein